LDILGFFSIILLVTIVFIVIAYLIAFILGRREDRDTYRRG